MRLFAYAETPVQYHVDIYRGLAAALGNDFFVFFSNSGLAKPRTYAMWGKSEIHNDTGLMDGYPHQIIENLTVREVLRRFRERGASRGDGLLMHTVLPSNSRKVVLAAKLLGLRLIYRGSSYSGPNELRTRNAMRIVRDRLSLLPMDVFCATGTVTWRFFAQHARGKPILFSPYVADEFAQEELQASYEEVRERKRRELGLRQEDVAYVYVGRFTGIKNVHNLLRAFGKLRSPMQKLFVAGDGPDRKAVLETIEEGYFNHERPVYLGFLQRKEVLELIAAADVLVLPSYYEPWGVVVNEAVRLGCVCVLSSSVGSHFDMIIAGKNGALIDPYSVDSIVSGLQKAAAIVQKGQYQAVNQVVSEIFCSTNAIAGVLNAWQGKASVDRPPGLENGVDENN